jgi:LmbE family N-acetylglucosaminyl deacetylase
MHRQVAQGHGVHLLTLTRGGATTQRFRLGLTVEQMGEIRYREMLRVADVLSLTGMRVLDLPDGGLKELDPRDIEGVVCDEIERLRPDVVVTYAVFGVSGFEDHLVAHAVVKRAYVTLKSNGARYLRRLGLYTIEEGNPAIVKSGFGLRPSKPAEIDCVVPVSEEDVEARNRALDCYETYQEVNLRAGIAQPPGEACFEIFQEEHRPRLDDLFANLPAD